MRGRAGIVAVNASLYRDFAITTALAVAEDPSLAETDEAFLREVCAGIDGLAGDFARRVYVSTEILYRLSCFPTAAQPPAIVLQDAPAAQQDAPPAEPATPPPATDTADPTTDTPRRRRRRHKAQE